MKLKVLVGSGSKIGLLTAPFLLLGLGLNLWKPEWFAVGGPPRALSIASAILIVPGIVLWIWSVVLILTWIPEMRLITTGPYALVKHPLYTGVALLVLPWFGFLCDSWLGALLGAVVYIGCRKYAPEEELVLAGIFREEWTEYTGRVLIPWL